VNNIDDYAQYNEIFNNFSYVKVSNLLDSFTIKAISRYFEYSINNPLFNFIDNNSSDDNLGIYWRSQQKTNDPSSKISRYADPFIEALLYELKPKIEKITGKQLHPTYSFSRIYMNGDELKKHVDRPSCEYSVTISVAYKNIENWPISMQYNDNPVSTIILNPGDAVVYKGIEVDHWRDKLQDNAISVQFMLHYVDANGPFSDYKYDKRLNLGTYERVS